MRSQDNSTVTITPLGGLGEIGKNMTVIEWDNNAIIIDAGFKFPDADLPGIDKVIPDITYIESIKHKVRAILLTHGHADHIGGLRYVLEKVKVPIYGTELTLGLADEVLPGSVRPVDFRKVTFDKSNQIAGIKVDFVRVNHSIPEGAAIALYLPAGIVLHTGDFKIDLNPIDGNQMDLQRFGELGLKGVLCLMADSTNADEPGYTGSESEVGKTFENIYRAAEGRIFLATFSTNIHRLQQIIDVTAKFGRKLIIDGKSIVDTIKVAQGLGYFKMPEKLDITPEQAAKMPDNKVVIVTTGTQGEPMSGLTKIANATHPKIRIKKSDTVIISADPIPGNESLVSRIVSSLLKLGATVHYRSVDAVHVSGHASSEEMKIVLGLIKPKYFIPVHGEYRQLWFHAKLAREQKIPQENIFICENGDQIQLSQKKAQVVKKVPAGAVYIDGASVGDIGTAVLKERSRLARDGFMTIGFAISKLSGEVLSGPEITSQGFIYIKESSDTIDLVKKAVLEIVKDWKSSKTSIIDLKRIIKDKVSDMLLETTRRRPLVLPMVLQI